MSLKNRFGLTLELGAAEALARADTLAYTGPTSAPLPSENPLFAFSDASHLPLYDFPADDRADPETPTNPETSASHVRMRFRDSAILRTEQVAGFSTGATSCASIPQPLTPAAYAPFSGSDDEAEPREPDCAASDGEDGEDGEDAEDVAGEEFVRLNYFVHNGYRYDGDIFELRPPQERSIGSRPERVLEHKPAVLMHRQVFNRVYSEGTYNNRPSSLRQMRLSARLSASSWASVSDMVAESAAMDNAKGEPREALLVVSPPYTSAASSSDLVATPERARKRISLLVEHALVTEEQAKNLKIASRSEGVPVVRAPRLVEHIAVENENVDPAVCHQKGAKNAKSSKGGAKSAKKGAKESGKSSSGNLKKLSGSRGALVEKKAPPVENAVLRREAKNCANSKKGPKTPKRRPFWRSLVSN